MDFIERWFGISPDHGNGVTEAIWLLALGLIAAGIGWRLFAALSRRKGADHAAKNR